MGEVLKSASFCAHTQLTEGGDGLNKERKRPNAQVCVAHSSNNTSSWHRSSTTSCCCYCCCCCCCCGCCCCYCYCCHAALNRSVIFRFHLTLAIYRPTTVSWLLPQLVADYNSSSHYSVTAVIVISQSRHPLKPFISVSVVQPRTIATNGPHIDGGSCLITIAIVLLAQTTSVKRIIELRTLLFLLLLLLHSWNMYYTDAVVDAFATAACL